MHSSQVHLPTSSAAVLLLRLAMLANLSISSSSCSPLCAGQRSSNAVQQSNRLSATASLQAAGMDTSDDAVLAPVYIAVACSQIAWRVGVIATFCHKCALPRMLSIEKKGKEKTTPFGINLMRSQALYWAARAYVYDRVLYAGH